MIRLRYFGVIAGIAILAILVTAVPLASASPINSEFLASGCNPTSILHQEWNAESEIDTTDAMANATKSPALQNLLEELGVQDGATYSSSFFLWSIGLNCVSSLQSINVVFTPRNSVSTFDIVVRETPVDFAISAVTVRSATPANNALSSSSSAHWTGYIASTSSGPNGQWIVPSESLWSGCSSACETDIWVGQTAENGGASGIAQVGTDDFVEETPIGVYHDYFAWYEYYSPTSNSEQECFPVSVGDDVNAGTWYLDGQYYTGLTDITSAQSCTQNQAMSMGAPNWANWIDEQQVNPNGGNFGTPQFSTVTVQYVEYGAWTDLLEDTDLYNITQASYTGLGAMTYDTSPSCASGFSCFTDYFTG